MRLIQLRRAARRLTKRLDAWRGASGQIYFEHRVDQYRGIWASVAGELGAEFVELGPDLWEIRRDGARTRVNNYLLQLDDPVTLNLAGRKPLVHKLLAEQGLPIPEHLVFDLEHLPQAVGFVKAHPRGCVIKPADAYGGKGVTTHVRTAAAARDAAVLASLYGRDLLVETQIAGESFRLLVFDYRLCSAFRRSGARVSGDGASPVRSLLDRAGIRADADCELTLSSQGVTLDDVLEPGRALLVRSSRVEPHAELRTIYDTDVTGEIAPSVVAGAERAARAVGSRFLGVDVITPDITRPLEEVGGCINEVNTTPALHHHYDSRIEAFPKAALEIVAELLGAAARP